MVIRLATGLVGMEGDSLSRSRGFESLHQILDGLSLHMSLSDKADVIDTFIQRKLILVSNVQVYLDGLSRSDSFYPKSFGEGNI